MKALKRTCTGLAAVLLAALLLYAGLSLRFLLLSETHLNDNVNSRKVNIALSGGPATIDETLAAVQSAGLRETRGKELAEIALEYRCENDTAELTGLTFILRSHKRGALWQSHRVVVKEARVTVDPVANSITGVRTREGSSRGADFLAEERLQTDTGALEISAQALHTLVLQHMPALNGLAYTASITMKGDAAGQRSWLFATIQAQGVPTGLRISWDVGENITGGVATHLQQGETTV